MPFTPYTPRSQTNMLADRPLGNSPTKAPQFTLHRTVANAADTLPAGLPTKASAGMNLAGYERALIQVVPKTGTPTPDIEVYVWSQDAGKFVKYSTAKAFSAPAANTPYTAEIDALDAIIWVAVTAGLAASQSVDILVAGSQLDHER